MKTFFFMWKCLDRRGWYQRTLKAATAEEAITRMRDHLALRADFPDNVVVDHPFHEKKDGKVVATHTLTAHACPFPVFYANVVRKMSQETPG